MVKGLGIPSAIAMNTMKAITNTLRVRAVQRQTAAELLIVFIGLFLGRRSRVIADTKNDAFDGTDWPDNHVHSREPLQPIP